MEINKLIEQINKTRQKQNQKISLDDFLKCLLQIEKLGSGFNMIAFNNQKLLSTQSLQIDSDQCAILTNFEEKGHYNIPEMTQTLKWAHSRCQYVTNLLVNEGIVWIDNGSEEQEYYIVHKYAE